jgi:uncharacterized protein YqgC (DUF456 family)
MTTALVAVAVGLAGLVGLAITLLGFSGVWLAIAVALVVQWLRPDTYNPWTLGSAVALGFLGEIAEFAASAIWSTRAGGTKRAAAGAIVGGLIGGIAGTPLAPIIGTLLGAAVGAGVGAAVMHQTREGVDWREAARVGQGAAIGRLVATAIKAALALAVAVMLTVDVIA